MNLTKFSLLALLAMMMMGSAICGKLKLVAFKRPHFGFIGLKVRTPKLLGLKHGHGLGGGFGGGHGGFGGGYHSSGYEHHEYHHESHSSGGGGFGGGWFGK